ncbi:MAG TPA: glutathione S-transferase N-terminal domain-containing protein, partial [Gemmatimonadota bacterium]|nr:glutathione S-transferase N-terminal domain-containing protein [Gemmatimonadota bacterium]
SFSHPSLAARRMLDLAGIEYRWVALPGGFHPLVLRAKGFRGTTVPALVLDGHRVQGTLEISRAVDAVAPGVLFPADPEARRKVEEAERWGERELQPVSRRIFRWSLNRRPWLRKALAKRGGMPLPGVASTLLKPLAARYARVSGATDAAVRTDMEGLPALLDRVDAWIEDGTIGGETLNAADLQIGTSVRAIMAFDDLRPAVEGRPAEALAIRILPKYPGPVPPVVPPEWRIGAGRAGAEPDPAGS